MRNEKGQFIKGFPYNKGIKRSADYKKKRSEAYTGRKLPKNVKKKMSDTHKRIGSGKRLRHERGEMAANWRGGLTPLKSLIRKCFQYRQWRSDVFTRDDFTCQICGIRGGRIIADHIKAFSLILAENNIKTFENVLNCEELWNINNGRTLCQNCHKETENYGGRNNKKICHRQRNYLLRKMSSEIP